MQELPSEVAEVPSPRVLDASDNALTRLPPQLPSTLNRLVLSNNRLASLAFLQHLPNLKVRCVRQCGMLPSAHACPALRAVTQKPPTA